MPPTIERLRQAGLKATGPRVMLCRLRLEQDRRHPTAEQLHESWQVTIPHSHFQRSTRRLTRLFARDCAGGYPTLAIVFGWMARLRITITRCAGPVGPFLTLTGRFFRARCHPRTCQMASRSRGCALNTM